MAAEQHMDCEVQDMDDEKIRQCFRKIEGKYEETPALKQYGQIFKDLKMDMQQKDLFVFQSFAV